MSFGRVSIAGALLVASAVIVGCASATKPRRTAPAAPVVQDRTLLSLAAILRAEDRRVVDDDLRAALADPSADIRSRAVRAIGRIGDANSGPSLEKAVSDPDPAVRAEAVYGLAFLSGSAGLPALLRAVADGEPRVRSAVASALGRTGDPRAAAAIRQLLEDPDNGVLVEACLASWKVGDASFAVEPLIRLSDSADPVVRFAAAYALGRLGSAGTETGTAGTSPARLADADRRRVRDRLLALAESSEVEIRMQAARGLASPETPSEVATLGTLSRDRDTRVQINAVRSLCYTGASLEPFITRALSSPTTALQATAVEGLGRIGNSQANDLLVKGIAKDKRTWLRELAIAALHRAAPDTAAGAAAGFYTDTDPEIRAAAARTLAGRNEPWARKIVSRLIVDPEPHVVAAAVAAQTGMEGSLNDLLGNTWSSADPVIRRNAARIAGFRLSHAGDSDPSREEGFALLDKMWERAKSDPSPIVRLEVLDAAARAGKDTRGHELLARGLDDRERLVRLRAIEALRRLFGEDVADKAGPAADLPLQDYVEILRWAAKPRAAVVTMQRPGFGPGRFTAALDTDSAPLAAWNFAKLADKGFFDGATIHRYVPNFVIQDGDPRGDGYGDPGYAIRDEIGASDFPAGTLAMASDGRDTAGSQWFVTLSAQPHLAGRYTAFGTVVQNFPGVVLQVLPGDKVLTIRVYEGNGTEPLPPPPATE